jgi:hypothetical protein
MFLFCDIDGVLIPFPDQAGAIPATHYRDQVIPTGREEPVPIWLNPAHGPLLADLAAATGLQPVWCTSWRSDAARLIGHRLGLPPWPHVKLPYLPITSSHPNGYLWKRDHVAPHATGQPLAWIDDDFTSADHDWAEARTASGYPTLLIQPDPHQGIQAGHTETIRRWALTLPIGSGSHSPAHRTAAQHGGCASSSSSGFA